MIPNACTVVPYCKVKPLNIHFSIIFSKFHISFVLRANSILMHSLLCFHSSSCSLVMCDMLSVAGQHREGVMWRMLPCFSLSHIWAVCHWLHVNTKNQTPSRILSMVVGAHRSAHIEIYGHTPKWNLSRRSVLSGRTVEMSRDNNAYETLCTVFHSAGGHIIYWIFKTHLEEIWGIKEIVRPKMKILS